MKIGLVLEGGGTRGIYTTGVLDGLLDEELPIHYVIGVSAGACHGVSYVSGQRGRGAQINLEYGDDPRYLSFRNLIFHRSMFGMKFIFEEIPHRLIPFDYESFSSSPIDFVTVCTEVKTGTPVYFGKEHVCHHSRVIAASSSIPCLAPMVKYEGKKYLDGGASDPIPIAKALEDGCDKVVVVLTRERGFRKTALPYQKLYRHLYFRYPQFIEALDKRNDTYNRSLDLADQLEKEGKAVIIAPESPLGLLRFEKDKEKLMEAYEKGINDVKQRKEAITALLTMKNSLE